MSKIEVPVPETPMRTTDRVFLTLLVALFTVASPVAAAESSGAGWSQDYPWWCNVGNETCLLYDSENHYTGTSYTDCYAILETGWTQQDAVDVGCAGNG